MLAQQGRGKTCIIASLDGLKNRIAPNNTKNRDRETNVSINYICNLLLHISSKIYHFEKLLKGAFEPLLKLTRIMPEKIRKIKGVVQDFLPK